MFLQAPPEPCDAQHNLSVKVITPDGLTMDQLKAVMRQVTRDLRPDNRVLRKCGSFHYKPTATNRGRTSFRLWCRFIHRPELDFEVRPATGEEFHDGVVYDDVVIVPVCHRVCNCDGHEVDSKTRDDIHEAMEDVSTEFCGIIYA